ncbi:MAG TPA: hypothetical protein VJ867_03585 [Gemmatimonadaceae bacterium]|nr:hypothetical protein [Gemmatimonadaceae bacterium]
MTTHAQALPDLDQLSDTYDIVGELSGRQDVRSYLARRREDGCDVLIVLCAAPERDAGNALNHLAADANLLAGLRHRSLLPVIEGRWVGDAFAVVLQRTNAPTLAELLNRRNEEFGYARIADILAETNGLLEWARAHKVVHRAVTPDTLYVEPGTDCIRVAFAVRPLPASGVPGPEADGQTIAALARAMLTRSPADPERETRPLAELRPGLPMSLLQETEQLLHPQPSTSARDATGYIARIAMADALKQAEEHLEATRTAIERQEQEHRAQIEKERREHEQQIALERKQHDEQIAAERKQHEKEIADARREHERLVSEQAKNFEREREQHAREFAEQQREFERRVAEQQRHFEKQVADQQKQFEKQVADQQKQFDKQVAEQQKQLLKEREEHTKLIAAQTKQMQRERERHDREIADGRRSLEREKRTCERELARQRQALEKDRATIAAEASLYANTSELPTQRADASGDARPTPGRVLEREVPPPPAVTQVVPPEELQNDEPEGDDDIAAATPTWAGVEDEIVDEDEPAWEANEEVERAADVTPPSAIVPAALVPAALVPPPLPPVPTLDLSRVRPTRGSTTPPPTSTPTVAWARRPHWRKSWNVPAAVIALVLLIGVTALALSGGGHATRVATVATNAGTRIVDSSGGNVYESVVPLPTVETDTGVLSATATDWTPPPKKRTSSVSETPAERPATPERAAATTEAATRPAPDTASAPTTTVPIGAFGLPLPPMAPDTAVRRPPGSGLTAPVTRPARRDSATRDTTQRIAPLPFGIPAPPAARRDSTPRPDTTAKRDSV